MDEKSRSQDPHEHEEESRTQDPEEHEEDPGRLRRTTEQGDDLSEKHSLALREHRAHRPYAPPRQPAQDPPSG